MSSKRATQVESWEDSPLAIRSIIIGIVVAVVGGTLLWWSSNLTDVPWAAFWSGISATFISVGAVGVLYEAFLKRALIRDIQGASQLDSRLHGTGITNATAESESIQPKEIFGGSTNLDIVPSHPLTWHESNFSWLTQLASVREIHCRIYLPEPTAYGKLLESVSSEDPLLINPHHCSLKFKQYKAFWESANVNPGSALEILYYPSYPQHGLMVSDNAAVVEVGDYRSTGPVGAISYVYQGRAANGTRAWLHQAIRNLAAAAVDGTPRDARTPDEILPLTDSANSAEVESPEGGKRLNQADNAERDAN